MNKKKKESEEICKIIYRNIEYYADYTGMYLVDLCKEAGIKYNSYMGSRKANCISILNLKRIADVFGVKVDALLKDRG